MKKFVLVLSAVLAAQAVLAVEVADPRTRTFVYPTRIVWHSVAEKHDDGWPARCAAEKMERLLEKKWGQGSEGYFATSTGTRLVNRGEPAGVLLDFGRELQGGIEIGLSKSTSPCSRLRIRLGESVAETLSTLGDGKHASNNHAMRDFEMPVTQFGSVEVGNTGFRFARIDLVSGGEAGLEFVRAISLMRPMERLGSFKSSDERLNRVWETALRTAHLCAQTCIWDGIKRDRLVWVADMHPQVQALMNVFGAQSVITESLDHIAAVTPTDRWMNTMSGNTLWWGRILADWYRYTGDLDYVRKHADYLEKTTDRVASFVSPSNTWNVSCFIDWPTQHNPAAVNAGKHALVVNFFRSAAFLFGELGRDAKAAECTALADRVASVKWEPCGAKSVAAHLALAGIRDPKEMYAEVLGRNGHEGVSTVSGYYMTEAMSLAGEDARALDTVRDYWGGMLDMGATSFWEDFKLSWTNGCFRLDEMPVAGKKDIHGDFGEFCYPGFRHSLCHGWSCGPAAWCINHVLGIRPLDVGCKTVEVKPFLGDLEWAEGAMALPNGKAVKVCVARKPSGELDVKVEAPEGVRIVTK